MIALSPVSTDTKRGGRSRPRTDDIPVTVPLPPDLVRALDTWIATQPMPRPDRSRAIRFAIREWLMSRELRRYLGQTGEGGPALGTPTS